MIHQVKQSYKPISFTVDYMLDIRHFHIKSVTLTALLVILSLLLSFFVSYSAFIQ